MMNTISLMEIVAQGGDIAHETFLTYSLNLDLKQQVDKLNIDYSKVKWLGGSKYE